jgi:hypothetical protein
VVLDGYAERRMSPATNEPGSAVLCTLPHTRPGTYIRRTPAGEDGGTKTDRGFYSLMVALAEVPRNAAGAQTEGRVA